MAYKQVRNFDKSKGGSRPGWCLVNVRTGYSIHAKYPTAWDAWKNTERHTGTIPKNVDVPVFFSYHATIDGIYKNWGHIGVRLSDGRFWSDGKTYSSIKAYTDNHAPDYVGWGESINGVRVIKEETNMPTLTNRTHLNRIYRDALGRSRSTGEGEDVYLNKDYAWVHNDIRTSDEAKRYRKKVAEWKARPKEVIKEVIKEVPVEKEIEVIREVPVEVIKEVAVEAPLTWERVAGWISNKLRIGTK